MQLSQVVHTQGQVLQAVLAGVEMTQPLHVCHGEVSEFVVSNVEVFEGAEVRGQGADGIALQQEGAEAGQGGEG